VSRSNTISTVARSTSSTHSAKRSPPKTPSPSRRYQTSSISQGGVDRPLAARRLAASAVRSSGVARNENAMRRPQGLHAKSRTVPCGIRTSSRAAPPPARTTMIRGGSFRSMRTNARREPSGLQRGIASFGPFVSARGARRASASATHTDVS
jgi:hypothetical protein